MEEKKKVITGKEIASKYRLDELSKFSKDELIDKYLGIVRELTALQARYETLNKTKSKAETTILPRYADYNHNWKGIDKVIYILQENKRALKSDEIVYAMIALEPNQKLEWRSPYSAVMKYITRGVQAGRIIKLKILTIGYIYCLPEWINEEGELNPLYIQALITNKQIH